MPRGHGVRDAAPHRIAPGQHDEISPTPSAFSYSLLGFEDGPLLGNGAERPAPEPPLSKPLKPPKRSTNFAASSHNDTDSLVRHAEIHGQQLLQLRNATSSFQRNHARFAPLREETLVLRSRLEFEWVVCADHRQFVSESEGSFLQEAAALLSQLPAEYSEGRLDKLYQQILQDHERQSEHLQRTRDTESSLANLEYRLQKYETRLAQAAERLVAIVGQVELPGNGEPVPPSSVPSEANPEEIHPLVQHYFEKAGEIGVARERIYTLETEHREDRSRRMLQIEQEIVLPTSDEEFESTYNRLYQEQAHALEDSIKKAELAKAVCLGEGLDPESYRKPPSAQELDDDDDDDHSPASDTEPEPGISSPLVPVTNEEVFTPPNPFTFDPFARPMPVPPEEIWPPYGPFPRPPSYHAPPLTDRVTEWIQDVADHKEVPSSRARRALSDHRQPTHIIQVQRRSSQGTMLSVSQAQRYVKQKDHDRYVVRLVGDKDERPALLKRSSSESALVLLASNLVSAGDVSEYVKRYNARART